MKIEVETNGEYDIQYSVIYDGVVVSDATVSFSCLENDKLTISANGKVVGLKYGEATCIAKVVYCGKEKVVAFTVFVKSKATVKIETAPFEIYAVSGER